MITSKRVFANFCVFYTKTLVKICAMCYNTKNLHNKFLILSRKGSGSMKNFFNKYFINPMAAMAQGLFASLLIGTIINTLGTLTGWAILTEIGGYASAMAGPAMAVAIAYSLKCQPLVIFSMAAVGWAANAEGGAGGPLAVFVIALVASVVANLISGKTKIDIILTPAVTVLLGGLLAKFVAPPIGAFANEFGQLIMWATRQHPFVMGIIVSVIVGVLLTLPVSSAAICASINLTGLAGGAALAGCCAQMVGFACASFRENKVGGLVAQGLGTSMLQIGNIMKNPRIWIAPTLASAITGPIATMVFKLEMNGPAISSGMGTCGLVGPIGVWQGWVETGYVATWFDWFGLVMICIVLPAVLTFAIDLLMRRLGWVKNGDQKLVIAK